MSDETAMAKATAWPGRIKTYTEELRGEMKLVTWPSWKQVRATTSVVIAAVFAFAFYFAVVDQAVGWAVEQVFKKFVL